MNAQVSEVLPATTTAVAEYTETARGLAELRQQLEGVEFDCTTSAGDKQARESRRALVSLRTNLEAKRKELKAPLLERSRLIDDEAKRITGEVVKLEQPIDAVIRAEEARREAIRAERERIEQARVDAHRKRIQAIRDSALELVSAPSSVIEQAIEDVAKLPGDFEEFQDEAAAAQEAATAKLHELLTVAKENERLQAELRAQREEQDRRRRVEDERIAAEHAELARRREAEDARIAEANRVAAAERAAADEKARAERDRLAAEQAEEGRRLQAQREQLERDAQEAAAAVQQAADEKRAEDVARLAAEEQAAIDTATLHDAARDALVMLRDLGQAETLVARKLNAALGRSFEAQA